MTAFDGARNEWPDERPAVRPWLYDAATLLCGAAAVAVWLMLIWVVL